MSKKGKKNVKDIQSALLSKTGFLNRDETVDHPIENKEPAPSIINDDIMEKLEALADYENTDLDEMVNKALGHFLRLKSMQVEKALKAKRNE